MKKMSIIRLDRDANSNCKKYQQGCRAPGFSHTLGLGGVVEGDCTATLENGLAASYQVWQPNHPQVHTREKERVCPPRDLLLSAQSRVVEPAQSPATLWRQNTAEESRCLLQTVWTVIQRWKVPGCSWSRLWALRCPVLLTLHSTLSAAW